MTTSSMAQMAKDIASLPPVDEQFERARQAGIARAVLENSKRQHWQTSAEARARGDLWLRLRLILGRKVFLRKENLLPKEPHKTVEVEMFWCWEHNGVSADYPHGFKGRMDGQYYFCPVCEKARLAAFEAKYGDGHFTRAH